MKLLQRPQTPQTWKKYEMNRINKLTKLGDAIAISNLKPVSTSKYLEIHQSTKKYLKEPRSASKYLNIPRRTSKFQEIPHQTRVSISRKSREEITYIFSSWRIVFSFLFSIFKILRQKYSFSSRFVRFLK